VLLTRQQYIVFSHRVLVRSKVVKCRCSPPTASFANAVCGSARDGLPFDFNWLGISGRRRLDVAALGKGWVIPCAPRLDPTPA